MIKFILDRVLHNILALSALGVLFFTVSGSAGIPGFWIYIATVLVYQAVSLLIIVPRYPSYVELAHVRKTVRAGVKKWDKVLVSVVMAATLLMYALAALDVGRVHASQLPWGFAVVGVLLYVIGSALNQWAMVQNPHFETGVRIQSDRSQQVITSGPYQYVRHPGYLGSLLGLACFPLIVGSGLALLASVICIGGMMARTFLEDKLLNKELAGYMEYARIVRYRLVPYVW